MTIDDYRAEGVKDGNAAADASFLKMLNADMNPATITEIGLAEVAAMSAAVAAMRDGSSASPDEITSYAEARHGEYHRRIDELMGPLKKFHGLD